MDDLISRQAALNETWREPRYTDPLNVLTEVRERIRSLPSAQPEHLQTVMKKIKEKYEKGMNTPSINKPMAWALYETWKEYDR